MLSVFCFVFFQKSQYELDTNDEILLLLHSVKCLVFTLLIIIYIVVAAISVFLGYGGTTSRPGRPQDMRSSMPHGAESWSTTHSG